ncbi:MAG: phytoene desaturase family protein [Candidatus Kapaibacterium sp.]
MSHVTIVGGGIGGLAAAVYLRKFGLQVLLIERHDSLGGKVAQLELHGFMFDLGPTVLTMPFVLRQLFSDCGRRMEEYLQIRPVDPICHYRWSDGTRFDTFTAPAALKQELLRVFPEDTDAVLSFLHDIDRLYDITKEIFLFNPFQGLREFFRPRNARLLPSLPTLGITSTVHQSLSRRFTSQKLIQFFGRFATYNGSTPYRAPATLNVIPHVELGFGAWYPVGGMSAVARALERLAREIGVEILTGTTVERMEREGDRITSVVANGERHATDAVISNVDVLWTYRNLLNPMGIATPRNVRTAERSCSGFLMLAAVRGTHPNLAHHNIFFSDDYPEEFRDIFERKLLPREMTIYLSIASKSDPSLAPEGCENWYILMNAPSSGVEHNDSAAAAAYADSVWKRLATFGLNPTVEWQSRLTPIDIEERYNSADGAIYGASSNSIFSAFRRPRNKVSGLSNFYFAGGSTHPGGGVPLVILSGKITAGLVHRDLAGGSL